MIHSQAYNGNSVESSCIMVWLVGGFQQVATSWHMIVEKSHLIGTLLITLLFTLLPPRPHLVERLDTVATLGCRSKLLSSKLLAGLLVSRTFLLCQPGRQEAQTEQKHEIYETLRADWQYSVYASSRSCQQVLGLYLPAGRQCAVVVHGSRSCVALLLPAPPSPPPAWPPIEAAAAAAAIHVIIGEHNRRTD